MIKNLPTLLSLEFESIVMKDVPCQILSTNPDGKFNHFWCNFHLWFAIITHLKNVCEPCGKLGQVESDVTHSTAFVCSTADCSSGMTEFA